ncbi:MAG: Tn3 family transposase [Cyanobacteria bacterium P01_F01_bin.86]
MTEQTAAPTQKRLQILGDDEIENLYGLPHFTPEEQTEYFALSPREVAAIEQLPRIRSRIYTILQLGYFKARHLFFTFRFSIVAADVEHIRKRYFPEFQLNQLDLGKVTRLNQQRLILELCNYHTCDDEARAALKSKAQQAARVCGKPIYIFRELIHHLEKQRLVAPGYSVLQNIVGQAITYEQDRLSTIVQSHLEETDIDALNQLLEDTPGLYEITQLKREPRDFSLSEIKREIYRGEQIQALYPLAQRLLPALEISSESIKYYASLVTYYSVFRLKRLAQSMVHVYLLCFIFHRYQRLHDNLISSLRYNVRRYIEASKSAAKEQVYEYRIEGNQNLQKAGQVLKLFTDDSIAKTASFQEVQAKAFEILERQKLDFVADHIVSQAKFDETAFQWEHVDTLAPQFKRNLRPVLLSVEFATSSGHTPLLLAIDFLKIAFQKGRSLTQYSPDRFPTQFIPDSTKRYLYASGEDDAKLLPDRYEFLVYRLLRNGLESGDVFCRDSVRFRSLEDDLIDEQQWQQKASLISATGLTLLKQPIREHLAELEQRLEARITEVNQRLNAGENEHFEIKKRGSQVRWTLHSPRASDTINHPIFDGLKQVNIGSVLHFVNQRCQFIDAFEHLLGRYTKQDADKRTLIATLIAWGTNMGLGRMGETSDMGYHLLAATSDNFIRLETLREANDLVSNAIAELPIFRHYDIGKALHSSSDGQKFESQIQTVNARHSPKYFGLKKGVVSYSLVANHVPVNARIIGANEHESHYVFDILFNNTTDIQPEVHSTDTHGANEVNFAILHMFGYQFAPRYRDIYDKVSNGLYGFKHPSQYEDEGPLKPIRKLNTALIIEEWDNIQRIMVSLALKTVTQSVIVGKLSAYARKNKTKRALWEYDNIIRSLYLLDYVDSVPLRQNVQRALNRGESYHQLRRAVSYANFGKLRFKSEYEQQIWGDCARLLTNCIIYYNASILSDLLTYKEALGDMAGVALLSLVSPVAWQHINFYGRYEFGKQPELIDLRAIIQQLARFPI